MPDQVTPGRLNELLKQLGIDQTSVKHFSPNNTEQQIKRRYHTIETVKISGDDDDDELDFDCYKNEKQLFKRITNLHRPVTKKRKSKEHILSFDLCTLFCLVKIDQQSSSECIALE